MHGAKLKANIIAKTIHFVLLLNIIHIVIKSNYLKHWAMSTDNLALFLRMFDHGSKGDNSPLRHSSPYHPDVQSHLKDPGRLRQVPPLWQGNRWHSFTSVIKHNTVFVSHKYTFGVKLTRRYCFSFLHYSKYIAIKMAI